MIENIKKNTGLLTDLAISLFAILLSFLVSAAIMLLMGNNPILAFSALFEGSFGSTQSMANTLSKSIPLIFTGLSFAFASKSGVFNIGGEGQLYLGALLSTIVSLTMDGLPRPVVITVSILAGFLGGALVGIILGFAKTKLHLNEVIVAIMLNYIISLFTSYMVNGPMQDQNSMSSQSEMINSRYLLSHLVPNTQLTTAIILAVLLAFIAQYIFSKTRIGFNIRAVGLNSQAAKASSIKVNWTMLIAMAIAGGLSGLAGTTEILGKHARLIDGFSSGFGFTGIAVSALAGNNPIGILVSAILFGAMDTGAMRMSYVAGVSSNMVNVIQGLVIIFVAAPMIAKKFFIKREVR